MKTYRMIDIAAQVRNGANIKQNKNSHLGYPITRIESISNGVFNRDKLGYADVLDDRYSEYYLKTGDVLVSHINSEKFLGRSVLVTIDQEEKIIHGMNLLNLRFKPCTVLPKFYTYFSQSSNFKGQVSKIAKKAVNQASFSINDFLKIKVPGFDLAEQNRIVSELDSIQNGLQQFDKILLVLEEYTKSLFNEMFGSVGSNEKGFRVAKLSTVASYWNGLTYKPSEVTDDERAGTLVLRSSNIQNGNLAFEDNVFVISSIKEKQFVKENDILMCSRNGSAKLVGKVALIRGLSKPTSFGAFMMIIRSNYYAYLKVFFESDDFRSQLKTGTSTINQITGKMMDEICVLVPPIEIVKSFEQRQQQIDKLRFNYQRQIEVLQELLDKKMEEYFGGDE